MNLRLVTKKLGTLLAAGAMALALAFPARANHEAITVDGNLADLITAISNNLGGSQGGFATADAVTVDVCTQICCFVNGFDAQNYYLFMDYKQPGGAVSSNMTLYAGWDVVGSIGDTDGDGDPNTFNPILHPGCAISDPAAPGKIGNNESYTIEIDFNCDGAADMSLSVTGDGGVTKVIRTSPGPAVDISAQSAFAINAGFLELRIDNFQAIVSAAVPGADLCHARITMTANSQNDGLGEDRSAIFALDVPPSLKITKTPSTQTVCPSGPVSWTIVVTNDGLCNLGTLAVDDTMDPGLIFDSSTPASTGDAQHRHWDFTNLASGATQSITLNAHSGDVCVAPVLHNTVHATGSHTPPPICGEPEAAEVQVTADVNCSSPTVTLDPAGPVCINASAIQLNGQPAGGTYSGTGVSASGLFNPAAAGLGSHVITYSFTDPNGCSGSAQRTIVVNGLPTVTLDPIGPFCPGAPTIQLNGQPAGGNYSGTGVSATGLFNPANAGVGSIVITYSFTDPNGCSGSAQRTIIVNPGPTVTLAPAGPLCNDAAAIQLNGQPAGGTYSGTGVSASGLFNPATAGVGSHVITYSFTDANGCSNTASTAVAVNVCEQVCWLTAGGAKIAGAKGPAHSWGGNVYPGCSPTAGDGGNWNHNAHDLNLHLLGTHIEVIRCGNVDGIPPGSKSPKTPNNFIEFRGTGRLEGVAGNTANYPLVYFFSRCEDRAEPGSKGQPDPLFVDRYYLHVYSNPANPAGSTLLLVNGNADPSIVTPVPITDGNMQIHITSCALVPVPQSAALVEQPSPLGPQGQQSQQAELAQDAPEVADAALRSDQPVPNPFSETTRIAYVVMGEARDVEIGIYDLAGRKLRSLISNRLEPGQYSVTWDGRTDRGERAPRGMYFVRTEVRGQAQSTRRVLYMK